MKIIDFGDLVFAFIPVVVALCVIFKWSLDGKNAIYAIFRMLLQLLLVGYVLAYIFQSENALIVIFILSIMVFSSSWIALRTVQDMRVKLFKKATLAILVGAGLTLIFVSQGVLHLDPWFEAHYIIPLAGMVFSASMNSVSVVAERFTDEIARGMSFEDARNLAMKTALIPIVNSLFAVGLVSLPGMMTGQILTGISPLIAVRYQIMVMCMIFSSSVISAAYFLILVKPFYHISSQPKKDEN